MVKVVGYGHGFKECLEGAEGACSCRQPRYPDGTQEAQVAKNGEEAVVLTTLAPASTSCSWTRKYLPRMASMCSQGWVYCGGTGRVPDEAAGSRSDFAPD
nr:hypothetical protein Itr_chr09CG17650 [Ipomoea trifida]